MFPSDCLCSCFSSNIKLINCESRNNFWLWKFSNIQPSGRGGRARLATTRRRTIFLLVGRHHRRRRLSVSVSLGLVLLCRTRRWRPQCGCSLDVLAGRLCLLLSVPSHLTNCKHQSSERAKSEKKKKALSAANRRRRRLFARTEPIDVTSSHFNQNKCKRARCCCCCCCLCCCCCCWAQRYVRGPWKFNCRRSARTSFLVWSIFFSSAASNVLLLVSVNLISSQCVVQLDSIRAAVQCSTRLEGRAKLRN